MPRRIRLDRVSAATHELVATGGRTLSKRFGQVVDHYGFEASRIDTTAIGQERALLAPLPAHRLPEFTKVSARVRRWSASTAHVAGRGYSVSSRLGTPAIGAGAFAAGGGLAAAESDLASASASPKKVRSLGTRTALPTSARDEDRDAPRSARVV